MFHYISHQRKENDCDREVAASLKRTFLNYVRALSSNSFHGFYRHKSDSRM